MSVQSERTPGGAVKRKGRSASPLFSPRYVLYDFIRLTAVIPGLIRFRPKKIFESDRARKKIRGGAMIMSNHTGFFDPVYLLLGIWYRRTRFIATKELFDGKFRKFLFSFGFMCIPIDRENFGLSTFRDIVSRMRGGQALAMFPEGHINREDGLAGFKSGVVVMAQKAGVPVVPIYIKRKKRFFDRLVFAVGEPLMIEDIARELNVSVRDSDAIAAYLYKKEEQLRSLAEGRNDR